jgi:hypothetical protein
MKRKILSLALALVMVLTLVPSAAASNDYVHNLEIYNQSEAKRDYLALMSTVEFEYIEEISTLAKSITQGISGDYAKVKAIHDWVAENVWYDYDAYYKRYEQFPPPQSDLMRGVCAYYATMTLRLLRAVGIPAVYVSGKASGALERNHAWNEAYVDGRWVIMDTTWNSGNRYEYGAYSEQKPASDKYFDISVEELSKSHRIEEYKGKKALGEVYNYVAGIRILDGVTRIENDSFFLFTGLTSLIMPNSVTHIGAGAFRRCDNLKTVVLSNSLTTLGDDAFHSCSSLKDIVLPNSLTTIGNSAFFGCESLTNIVIPKALRVLAKACLASVQT